MPIVSFTTAPRAAAKKRPWKRSTSVSIPKTRTISEALNALEVNKDPVRFVGRIAPDPWLDALVQRWMLR